MRLETWFLINPYTGKIEEVDGIIRRSRHYALTDSVRYNRKEIFPTMGEAREALRVALLDRMDAYLKEMRGQAEMVAEIHEMLRTLG